MQNPRNFTLHVSPTLPVKSPVVTLASLDMLNSICWLSMDALWMFNLPRCGIFLGLPTLATALLLFKIDRNKMASCNHWATLCWIFMNVLWLISDTFSEYNSLALTAAKIFLGLGILFVTRGMFKTGNLSEALAHYKRYKVLGRKNVRAL